MIKEIKGYEGFYEISDNGDVYSCERLSIDGKYLKRRKLKGGCYPNEYEFVILIR